MAKQNRYKHPMMSKTGSDMVVQAVGEKLAFARQLVGHVSRRTLLLHNAGQLPARWALAAAEPLPAPFALSALHGLLAPAAEARVHVDFGAEKECTVAARLVLEVGREQSPHGDRHRWHAL